MTPNADPFSQRIKTLVARSFKSENIDLTTTALEMGQTISSITNIIFLDAPVVNKNLGRALPRLFRNTRRNFHLRVVPHNCQPKPEPTHEMRVLSMYGRAGTSNQWWDSRCRWRARRGGAGVRAAGLRGAACRCRRAAGSDRPAGAPAGDRSGAAVGGGPAPERGQVGELWCTDGSHVRAHRSRLARGRAFGDGNSSTSVLRFVARLSRQRTNRTLQVFAGQGHMWMLGRESLLKNCDSILKERSCLGKAPLTIPNVAEIVARQSCIGRLGAKQESSRSLVKCRLGGLETRCRGCPSVCSRRLNAFRYSANEAKRFLYGLDVLMELRPRGSPPQSGSP